MRYSIVQHGDQLLGQQRSEGEALETTLLATDQQRLVLQALKADHSRTPLVYSPYGHRPTQNGLPSLLGFNGERQDPVTGHYLLGNGYRAYNPVLMRFNSPDSLSPFEKGGLNSYAYCVGDPVNLTDPLGHNPFKSIWNSMRKSIWRSLISDMADDPSNLEVSARLGDRSHPKIQRRLSDPGPKIIPLIEPDFVGYHGTSEQSAQKLIKNGLNQNHEEPWLFFTSDIELARDYANNRRHPSTGALIKEGSILEIHVQNITGMTPGKDYDFRSYELTGSNRLSMAFTIRTHLARAIDVRRAGLISPTKKAHPRALEAPF
jgi:RHS repeat-associated protein